MDRDNKIRRLMKAPSYIRHILLLFILYEIFRRAKKTRNGYIMLAATMYAVNVLFSSIQSSYPGNNSMVMLTFIATLMPFCAEAFTGALAGAETAAARTGGAAPGTGGAG